MAASVWVVNSIHFGEFGADAVSLSLQLAQTRRPDAFAPRAIGAGSVRTEPGGFRWAFPSRAIL